MKRLAALAVSVFAIGVALTAQQKQYPYPMVRDQRGAVPAGPRVGPWNSPPLGDGPFLFDSYEQRGLRAVVVAKGLSHPWSIAFLPDNVMLITERQGRLRVVRGGTLEPEPVAGIPAVTSIATMAGLMDIALHPNFAQNHWVYISYHKPMGTAKTIDGTNRDYPIASNSILRGTWNGKGLTDIHDVFVADDVDMEASRITFGPDGMLYMGIGGPGTGSKISMDRAQGTNDLAGKILRMTDDGKVPPDNPFVGKVGYKPYIYSIGHRVELGLQFNPYTNELWETENGPNGGDEMNIIRAGHNYGWPIVSYGRDYNGPRFSPTLPGFDDPIVFWVPSIATSGLAFYTGDKFPGWKRNVFVGGMREGEIARSGQIQRIVFNDKWEEMRREPLLRELHQRVRDIRQGPDGLLYLITDEDQAALLRIEPVQ